MTLAGDSADSNIPPSSACFRVSQPPRACLGTSGLVMGPRVSVEVGRQPLGGTGTYSVANVLNF